MPRVLGVFGDYVQIWEIRLILQQKGLCNMCRLSFEMKSIAIIDFCFVLKRLLLDLYIFN